MKHYLGTFNDIYCTDMIRFVLVGIFIQIKGAEDMRRTRGNPSLIMPTLNVRDLGFDCGTHFHVDS